MSRQLWLQAYLCSIKCSSVAACPVHSIKAPSVSSAIIISVSAAIIISDKLVIGSIWLLCYQRHSRQPCSCGCLSCVHLFLLLCSLLRKENGTFAPAYMLADSRLERAGRTSKETPEQPVTNSLTRSAAVVVIGDEILAAKVQDTNTPFLCSELRAIGWRVCKV